MITLEDFWMAAKCPVYDAETKEYIDSIIVQEHSDAEVINFTVSNSYKNDGSIYVEYEKEPENET